MVDDPYQYDRLVENALRRVVHDSLVLAAEEGLVGEHHFYITFRTDFPGVDIPPYLHERYEQEMTIILQHQFWDLDVGEDRFSVHLSFEGRRERLVVPFDAVTGFADPSARFGLQFRGGSEAADSATASDETASDETAPGAAGPDAGPAENGDNVVTLDRFRKS